MASHLDLSIRTVLHSIEPQFIQEYCNRLKEEHRPKGWAILNADLMEQFLIDPENDESASIIKGEFNRIHDLAHEGKNILNHVFQKYEIPFKEKETHEQMAMRLLLYHAKAFDFCHGALKTGHPGAG